MVWVRAASARGKAGIESVGCLCACKMDGKLTLGIRSRHCAR